MKRTQLIEYGIIVIGLFFGYKFFEGIFGLLVQVFYQFESFGSLDALLPLVLMTAAYAVAFILIIRKSNRIAVYINGPASDENIPLKIGKRALLQVILIAICAAAILSDVADILLYLFETFKKAVERKNPYEADSGLVNEYRFKVAAVQTIVALVILYFSKDISNWFVRKNEVDELTFDSTNESN